MQTKECITCHETKTVHDFHYRKDSGGFTGECKACRSARSRARYRADPARHKALTSARHASFGRFARYGLTKDEYMAILERQGGVCALCGSATSRGKTEAWHIDHEHRAGEKSGTYPQRAKFGEGVRVRGLLCYPCNIAVGHYESLRERVGFDKLDAYLSS